MAAHPTVSVLLPVRNGEAFLEESLGSLLCQSLSSMEILAVDDGSVDGSGEILRRVARADSRVRVFSQEPRGIVAALELGRSRARGRYLARMDADDVALPGRMEAQVALMESDTRIVASGTGVEYFPREMVKDGSLRYQDWINGLLTHEAMMRDLFVECPLPHPALLMRADSLDLVGGYREVGWPEDYDLMLRLWSVGGRFAKVPDVLLRWRESPTRLSRTHPSFTQEAFRRCKVHFLLRTHLAEGRGVVVWGAGPVGKAFARELKAQGGELEAFVDLSPRKQGQEVHGVRVISPEGAGKFSSQLHLAAVGQPGAREEIRRALEALGMRESEDFLAVA
jgi:cellulose synthase/poly-beta-1,6-N-acetylglucosamine synthase-like glycosyltransferase